MNDKKNIIVFESSFQLSNYLVKKFKEISHQSLKRSGRFNIALSGGRSSIEFYSKLSAFEDSDVWLNTHIFMTDDNYVPKDDKESNYRIIKENLLNYINVPQENIHVINTEAESVALAAEEYKNDIISFFALNENGMPSFDLILLEVGEDGHVASLYPDDESVNDPKRIILPVSLNHLKHECISLTLSVINNARNVYVLLIGSKGSGIAKKVIDEHLAVPASKLKMYDGELSYLLDYEAASQLSHPQKYFYQDEPISI